MSETTRYKDYTIVFLIALVVLLLFLLFGKTNEITPSIVQDTNTPSVIIVDDEPLPISDELKQFFTKHEIVGITLGDKTGKIRLVSIDGRPINPCAPKDNKIINKSTVNNVIEPCKADIPLNEVHLLIGGLSEIVPLVCSTCKVNGVSKSCDVGTNKYTCSAKTTVCPLTSPCGL
jgi:hypothetical protein